MLDIVRTALRGYLMRLFLIVLLSGAIAFLIAPPKVMTETLNFVAFTFAGAVIVAYWPAFWRGLIAEKPTIGQMLAVGVFLTQLSSLFSRAASISYISFGLIGVVGSSIVSLFVLVMATGAVCHLNAPEISNGAVPGRQWIRIGVLAGTAILIATLIIKARS